MHLVTYRLTIEPPRTTLLADLAQAARVLGLRLVYRDWRLTIEPHP